MFDCIIVGDEPAGLWFLNRYHELLGNSVPAPRLGWLSFTTRPTTVPVPVTIAKSYGIKVKDEWAAEIITPKETLVWDKASIQKRFPELPAFENFESLEPLSPKAL